jgi:diguanylate cyclase (GGDEF)-like protein
VGRGSSNAKPAGTLPTPGDAFDQLETLKEAAVTAGGATKADSYLQQAVEQMGRLVGADRCSLFVLRDDRLFAGGAIGLPADYMEALDGAEIGPAAGTCGTAAFTGAPVITRDIRSDPKWAEFRDLADAAGVRSCWSVPVKLPAGPTLGTFATYTDIPHSPTGDELELAQAHASLVALGLERIQHGQQLTESYESVILALSSALDARDKYTAAHSTAAAELAVSLGARLGLSTGELHTIEQVAVLHDIGKLGIPTDILNAPRKLTDEEWELVRQHPILGERILAAIPFLDEVARAVRHEHERWDGRGYPDGVAGEAIPMASRIVFACDAWHAMTSDRVYSPAISEEAAAEELLACAGTQFDPRVAEALVQLLEVGSDDRPTPAENTHDRELDELASILGAEDLFVFRKVAPDTFCHFGGVGRGEGWAGNIELRFDDEELFRTALESGEARCIGFEERSRIVGPYYGKSAVVVPCRSDLVVVFGSSGDALRSASRDTAWELAEQAALAVEQVPPAKRLADELEVLEAVRKITSVSAAGLEATLGHIADELAGALSCEFGAVLVFGEDTEPSIGVAERGWSPGDAEAARDLLVPFASGELELPVLVQDVAAVDQLPPVLAQRGATSVHALPIGAPVMGVVLMVHADPVPRGFTNLCRRVARTAAEAAEAVIRRARVHEELSEENARLSQRVRTDALTGVASRAAWQEALAREDLHRSRTNAPTAVAVFDVDNLKATNDRDGHPAGDELLKASASVLARSTRATDLVARIGGDEFAVLLRYADDDSAATWMEGVQDAVRGHNEEHPDQALGLTGGHAATSNGTPLADVVAAADRAMYVAKQARR